MNILEIGIEKGRQEGLKQGIRAMVQDNLEEGVEEKRICALILAQFVFVLLVWGAGKAATQLAQNGSALARTSLGSGYWRAAALALLACSDAIR